MLLAKEAVTQKVYSQQIQVKQIQYDKIIQRQLQNCKINTNQNRNYQKNYTWDYTIQ